MRERPHRKMLKKLLLLLWLPFFVSLVSFSNFSESAGVAFRNLSACAFHRSQDSCDKRSKMSVPVSTWRICGPDGAKVLATSSDAWLDAVVQICAKNDQSKSNKSMAGCCSCKWVGVWGKHVPGRASSFKCQSNNILHSAWHGTLLCQQLLCFGKHSCNAAAVLSSQTLHNFPWQTVLYALEKIWEG